MKVVFKLYLTHVTRNNIYPHQKLAGSNWCTCDAGDLE